jgi:hypothetical protein
MKLSPFILSLLFYLISSNSLAQLSFEEPAESPKRRYILDLVKNQQNPIIILQKSQFNGAAAYCKISSYYISSDKGIIDLVHPTEGADANFFYLGTFSLTNNDYIYGLTKKNTQWSIIAFSIDQQGIQAGPTTLIEDCKINNWTKTKVEISEDKKTFILIPQGIEQGIREIEIRSFNEKLTPSEHNITFSSPKNMGFTQLLDVKVSNDGQMLVALRYRSTLGKKSDIELYSANLTDGIIEEIKLELPENKRISSLGFFINNDSQLIKAFGTYSKSIENTPSGLVSFELQKFETTPQNAILKKFDSDIVELLGSRKAKKSGVPYSPLQMVQKKNGIFLLLEQNNRFYQSETYTGTSEPGTGTPAMTSRSYEVFPNQLIISLNSEQEIEFCKPILANNFESKEKGEIYFAGLKASTDQSSLKSLYIDKDSKQVIELSIDEEGNLTKSLVGNFNDNKAKINMNLSFTQSGLLIAPYSIGGKKFGLINFKI